MPRISSSSIGNLDKLLHWIQHIKRASRTQYVVTQHKKARDLLISLGCQNVFYPLEPLVDFADLIAASNKPVILLYDGDRRSNSKCEKMKSMLQQRKVKVSTGFRKIIFTQQNKTFDGLLKHIYREAGSIRKQKNLPYSRK